MTAFWTSNEGQWHPELRIKPPPRRVNFHSRCHSLQRLSMSNHCSASTIGVPGPHPVCQTARIAPLAADQQGQDARDTIGPGQRTQLHNCLAVPTRCFTLGFPPWLGVTGLEFGGPSAVLSLAYLYGSTPQWENVLIVYHSVGKIGSIFRALTVLYMVRDVGDGAASRDTHYFRKSYANTAIAITVRE
jgi:hypothetical protein